SGGSGMATLMGDSSDATITAYLKKGRDLKTAELIDVWRDEVGTPVDYDISITAASQTMSMGGGDEIEIALESTDFDAIKEGAKQVKNMMVKENYLLNVTNDLEAGNPQAEVVVDPIKASAKGLAPKSVMGTLYSIMEGTKACTITQDGRDYDVRIEYPNDRFESISDLASLNLTNAAGVSVPLLDIATIEYSNSPLTIMRSDGRYYAIVKAQQKTGAPTNYDKTVKAKAEALELPRGVEVAQSSMDQDIQEEFTNLLMAIASAVILVFIVMAMQFESPIFSGVVMISIPFALIGSFFCLLVCRCTISMTSLMGVLMLTGTVVNNGILLIDTANAMREERNLSAEDAVLTAGMLRMRPIFMTTLTTILAMVPMGIGIGSNAAMMRGMAMVIIGGLIASTVLTLLLIPTFYLLTDKRERQRRKALRAEKKAAKKAAKA
ncbi:MAG: efflux RND transporter permease subunit, partial [Oscillospiraceae bacterium]|nr:efflux RND transporter permease subunit [Oscillospiraceae bacterium]